MNATRWMLAGACLLLATTARATNVLVFVVDDLGADKVANFLTADEVASQSFLPETPTLDELSGAGLRFTSAWATPVCSASRASFLTGLFPSHNEVGDTCAGEHSSPDLSLSTPTIADVFQSAGYATGAFGKWHVGQTGVGGNRAWPVNSDCPAVDVYADDWRSVGLGFDYYFGEMGSTTESYQDWGLAVSTADGTTAICRSYEHNDEETSAALVDWVGTQWDAASGTMSPYFGYYGLHLVHFDGDGGGAGYEIDDIPPACGVTEACLDDGVDDSCGDADGDGVDDEQWLYSKRMIECADQTIGNVLDGIDALGEGALDDTLVVVFGDNGSPLEVMEPPFTDGVGYGKGTTYQTGVHVPLIIAEASAWRDVHDGLAPAPTMMVAPGRAVTRDVVIADMYDTLVEAAGLGSLVVTDGESMAPCFTNATTNCGFRSSRPMYTERYLMNYGEIGNGDGAVKRGKWVLHLEFDDHLTCIAPELFNVQTDPYETTDLYDTMPQSRIAPLKLEAMSEHPVWFPTDDKGHVVWCK